MIGTTLSGRLRHLHKLKSPVLLAAVAASFVTVVAIGVGVSDAGIPAKATPAAASIRGSVPDPSVVLDRSLRHQQVTRSSDRLKAQARLAKVTRKHLARFATSPLNVRTAASWHSDVVRVVTPRTRLVATGIRDNGFAEVALNGRYRWVTAQYLSVDRPAKPAPAATSNSRVAGPAPATAGISDGPCPDSAVEQGLTPGAVRVHRAVCHSFPQITTYGGYAPRGEHASGKAIDVMTSDVALGNQIADFLRAHAAELNLYDVIWHQHIWTPVRSSEGWRAMPDRGSVTANHDNHVHVSVN